ncbi:MAG: hypothetical protein LBU74_07950 [Methanobacteriaceae archaeon]|jgi:hypothetical protein|nr:hypothetical protein [Candidatus Methanorudis spinitermitis]
MGLKDLREKFHDYDAKFSSLFHKDKERLKKPSWGKIIPTWLGLVIVLSIISSIAIVSVSLDVNEELTPVSSYDLKYNSYKSSFYFIYSKSANGPNQEVYHISYDGRLKIELDTSDISHNDYFGKIMESYLNGNNEYNASVDVELTAYDNNDEEIKTTYTMGLDDSNLNIKQDLIDFLFFKGSKIRYKDGILTIITKNKDERLSDSSLSDSLNNIDHIDGVIHVFNKNALKTSDSGFYKYTLNFTIPKTSINIKHS